MKLVLHLLSLSFGNLLSITSLYIVCLFIICDRYNHVLIKGNVEVLIPTILRA